MSLPSLVSTPSLPQDGPLSRQQKATIIVRLLQSEGIQISLSELPEDLQIAMTQEMSAMRHIKRSTLTSVVTEFVDELEELGLTFPRGVPGAVNAMEDSISPTAAARLRSGAGVPPTDDPWEKISTYSLEKLLPVLEEEAIEIASVLLSKLDVTKSAELLGQIPGERARRIAYAMSQTTSVSPDTVRKIGNVLLLQFQSEPPKAFEKTPVERVGEILNSTTAGTREVVLAGLIDEDQEFGESVKKAIFTFVNIRGRVEPVDVPKILRDADNDMVITALAYAGRKEEEGKSAEFILENISQRMAAGLRDEIDATGKIKDADGEAAMGHVIGVIRDLQASGEIVMKVEGEDDEEDAE